MKSNSLLAIGSAVFPLSFAWKEPAPISSIDPLELSSFYDYVPQPGHGYFSNKNESVAPYQPVHHKHYGFPPWWEQPGNGGCSFQNPAPQAHFWLADIPHQGTSPFLNEGASYKVFRNVKDYGAKGDGVTDDTAAIQQAIDDGGRVGGGFGAGGITGQPALVYIPPGTYSIAAQLQLYIGTQIVGDAVNLPTIKASKNSRAVNVVNAYDSGQPSTNNFFIGIRNINIDTTNVAASRGIHCLNWAVSQATNLININFIMAPNSQHIGIIMDGGSSGGGSGTFMGDLTFTGGLIGVRLNNQQYEFKNMKFTNISTGIAIQHLFVANFQRMTFVNCGVAVDMTTADTTGDISLIDSTADNCGVVVNGSATFILENIHVTNSGPTLLVAGKTLITGSLDQKTYAYGHVYYDNTGTLVASNGTYLPYTKRGNVLVDSSGKYVIKAQPQYTQYSAQAFVSVKDVGAKGDGQTDDTAAINAALKANAGCKITYFPHGVYVVTDTIYVPPCSRIVGEVLSEISASGPKFADSSNPHVMFQVGKPGEVGEAEISEMLFTVADVLPGAILVEVNMKGTNAGDVSFHNSHFRVGGAADSLTETNCQTNGQPCKAAFLVLHLTATAQTYIENMWAWTADHDLDGLNNQVIGTGRGMLIEATQGTWLVGTASEHHILYGYQLYNAQNVFIGMNQVETPYYQPVPQAPFPWTPNATWHDPTFAGCNGTDAKCYMQWAMRIVGPQTNTVAVYGSGFWVFFNNYQGCGQDCQANAVALEMLAGPGSGVYLYDLNTLNVRNMVVLGGSGGTVVATRLNNLGSWGGVVAAYLGYA